MKGRKEEREKEEQTATCNLQSATFVGFGFGAIQAGLFLYEAWCSGNFGRLVVAEVMQEVVAAVRANGGFYTLNLAHADRVESVRVGPLEIYNPAVVDDREKLVEALVAAQEIATAVPSVSFYKADAPGSIHRLLAQAVEQKLVGKGPQAAIYAAENNNHAAELLSEAVMAEINPTLQPKVPSVACFVNTVLIKMCGILPATEQLPPITPTLPRSFLVEVHNRIQISTINFDESQNSPLATRHPPFTRSITIFEEKPDLLPFEEAKLYTLNSVHAVGAYIGAQLEFTSMAQLPEVPGLIDFLVAITICYIDDTSGFIRQGPKHIETLVAFILFSFYLVITSFLRKSIKNANVMKFKSGS